jgi:hypothetical protein
LDGNSQPKIAQGDEEERRSREQHDGDWEEGSGLFVCEMVTQGERFQLGLLVGVGSIQYNIQDEIFEKVGPNAADVYCMRSCPIHWARYYTYDS